MKHLWTIFLALLFVLPACGTDTPDDDDDTTVDDDDTTDDDDSTADDDDSAADDDDDDSSSDDDDSAPPPPPAPPGSVLCASGGPASAASGLTAILCTGPLPTGASHGVVARLGPRPHRPTEWPQSVQFRIASDSGIPRSVIRLRMLTPIIASLLCPFSDRERSRGPRICLNRPIPFSARAC